MTLLEKYMKTQIQIGTLPILSILLMASLPGPIFGQGDMSRPGGKSAGGRPGMGMGSDTGMESMEGMESISQPSLTYTVDDKNYLATRVRSFHYVLQSFRPKELAYADGGGMMREYGRMGSGGSGMPGMSGPGYPGAVSSGGGSSAGYLGPRGYASGSPQVTNQMVINIHAFIFDGEKTNDRTRIELMIEQPYGMGMDGLGGMEGMSGGPEGMGMSHEPLQMQPFASIKVIKIKSPGLLGQGPILLPPETKLVTDIICQTIWKSDVVQALFVNKGQGDSAKEIEAFLKQLLAEQYDT